MHCHVCCCIAVETAVDIDERQVSLATAVVENHLTFARQVYNGRMDAWVHGDVILLYPAGRSRIHLIWTGRHSNTLHCSGIDALHMCYLKCLESKWQQRQYIV